ncbi:MAG: hypothetical protein Q9159_006341 [Coniocarpon cinnabarinum]
MNQYPGVPPQGPSFPPHPSRRQDYPYAASPHPPQYIPYYAPTSPHPGQIQYGPPQHYMPQWYPYQHYPFPPQPQPQQPPRHYPHHHQSPLIVSSTTHQPVLPVNRQYHPPPPLPTQHQQSVPPVARTPVLDQSAASSTTSQNVASPSTTPITTSDTTATPPILPAKAGPQASVISESQQRKPFNLQLPWFSVPESSFPDRPPRRRRRRRTPSALPDTPTLPAFPRQRPASPAPAQGDEAKTVSQVPPQDAVAHEGDSQLISAIDPPNDDQLSAALPASTAPSETTSTIVPTSLQPQRSRAPTRPIVPALPNIGRRPANSAGIPSQAQRSQQTSIDGISQPPKVTDDQQESKPHVDDADQPEDAPSSPVKVAPKSWAELLRSKNANSAVQSNAVPDGNGNEGLYPRAPSSGSLSDALRSYDVQRGEKISFLEPRGLLNTGNMCYMNSILQVLAFCVPFFELLDQIRKRAVHSFKSNTPLLEAMIMFMNEYSVIDSASSVEQLRLRLKDAELEQYGEAFIPEYVYEAIKNHPRFSSMRRGQQQDAEEFLGLLLEVLHLECLSVMDRSTAADASSASQVNGADPTASIANGGAADGWMEVQRHQKPAVTQTSGASALSPVTKIFGGALRSEFRVSGNKNSVTMTPYQQLQLDINDPAVTNISHALKNLARSEKVDGEFATSRGTATYGTKQFFIETLPPVLILHLKRFHYDSVLGSTQKIWKRVGYPLDLEIPKESFAPSKRAQYSAQPSGMPRYRLTAVVYHHGKHASGGHYTVDVRRQEGHEWIRLDDTVIRRVRAEDVANEGGEEDPKILAAALERHKREEQNRANNTNGNPYVFNDDADTDGLVDSESAEGWSQVAANGVTSPPSTSNGGKKWSGVVTNGTGTNSTGTATPKGAKTPRDARGASAGGKGVQKVAGDKVAYILFYERT